MTCRDATVEIQKVGSMTWRLLDSKGSGKA